MNIFLVVTEPAVEAANWTFGKANLYNDIIIVALVVVMITLLFSAMVVYRAMRSIIKVTMPHVLKEQEERKLKAKAESKIKWNKSWLNFAGLRPIDQEKDIMMDHKFDGISELDNPVPIWFNMLFYGTIIFGLIYLFIFQFSGIGLNQDQEYTVEIEKAEIAKKEYLAKMGNQVDENSVEFNPAYVAEGKTIFMANCVSCHKADGGGDIGPNLTDRFWLHGGEIQDIFKVVKYGAANGMVAWEDQLTPLQIAQVSSYIITLRDTKPAVAKAPQGVEVVYADLSASSEEAAQDSVGN